jgi:hypothetical protein
MTSKSANGTPLNLGLILKYIKDLVEFRTIWGVDLGGWTIERPSYVSDNGDFNGDGVDDIVMWDPNSGIALLTILNGQLQPIDTSLHYSLLGTGISILKMS